VQQAGIKVEQVPIDRVVPYEKNPRKGGAVDKVAASLREFGWKQPIVVDGEMVVIAGHTRLAAARQLGMAEVPVVIARDLDPVKVKAYRIADNRSAQDATWDAELLGFELADLQELAYDLPLLGFEPAELNAYLQPAIREDEDDVPEAPEEPVSKPGDLWLLGKHRLLCGDATVASDVQRALGALKPLLMVTDPPYGVDYDPDWRNRNLGKADRATGVVHNDKSVDWREAWALFPGDVAYVWHASGFAAAVQSSLAAVNLEFRSQIVWAKPRFVISRGDYHWQHECCWYAVRKGRSGHWSGDRSQTTLWQITHQKSETGHGTQKPVEAMRRPILNNSLTLQAVYDPFVGSGTTIIAAETTGRVCAAIEIDPTYVDVAVKRWQNFADAKATLDGDGRTFDELSALRAPEQLASAVG
jgi:DNA modification methylase